MLHNGMLHTITSTFDAEPGMIEYVHIIINRTDTQNNIEKIIKCEVHEPMKFKYTKHFTEDWNAEFELVVTGKIATKEIVETHMKREYIDIYIQFNERFLTKSIKIKNTLISHIESEGYSLTSTPQIRMKFNLSIDPII